MSKGQASRLGAFRLLLHRFTFLTLIMVAFGLMLLGKADTLLIDRLRAVIGDAFTPLLEVLSRPAANVTLLIENMRHLVMLRAENARLHEENMRLLHWQAVALHLESENHALRDLLKFIPGPTASFISARVIAVTDGPFVRSALLNAGRRDGVRKGQAVVTGAGLAGRVDRVGSLSARILLLTDTNSRIPVIVTPSRNRALLISNKGTLQLIYMIGDGPITPGNRVVTAEDAYAFPPDLPVGIVTHVYDSFIEVHPFVQPATLEYVRLVDYGLSGILPDSPQRRGTQ
ncbi:Rod shape-determining protein MreC [invertebrate metagenome]|uniref:Cell shape-determining protein MreC n=1 Tax=invertebrate metagenome TaxID=1711999 RepID=A0A484H8K4_9ZZZZ